jgi:hypothetical protein
MLTTVTLGSSQLRSRSWFHRCRHRPTLFLSIRQSLRLVTEPLQLHRTRNVAYFRCFTAALTPGFPSQRLRRSSISQVGNGNPIIAPDAYGSYPRFFAAVLTLVVPSLCCRPPLFPGHSAIPEVGNGTPTIQTAWAYSCAECLIFQSAKFAGSPSRHRDG